MPSGFESSVSHNGSSWVITNDDTPKRDNPHTGQNWLLSLMLGAVGASAIGYGIAQKKKRRNTNEG